MTRVVYHPYADAEIIAAAEWYDKQQPGLGARFLDEVDAGLSRIRRAPEAFGVVVRNVRQHILHRFPFGIVYRVDPDRIYVLAVMHLHRKPMYWRNRV
jgi:toxin ParE1/3/4